MKKTIMISILALVLSVVATPAPSEEIAEVGAATGKTYYTGTFKIIPMGSERVQVSYEAFGVNVSDPKEGLLHNASGHCIGGFHAVKGVYRDDAGFCVFTRPDGDQVFITFRATGETGKRGMGNSEIVGGTGKFIGITGSGEFTRHNLRPPKKGHFAIFDISTLRWKLPETKK